MEASAGSIAHDSSNLFVIVPMTTVLGGAD
jgi:hypothetical protein